MEEIIINKVAQSAIETLNLERFFPEEEIIVFDLKDFLFMGLIVKEKEYREQLKNTDWEKYRDKIVCINCTADAIIPLWAYMLATVYLEPVAKYVMAGSRESVLDFQVLKNLSKINIQEFEGKRVVIKGCGEKEISPVIYTEITRMLKPIAKSIMYGEPCSTVPVYKKK